jgi:hypothetical protein
MKVSVRKVVLVSIFLLVLCLVGWSRQQSDSENGIRLNGRAWIGLGGNERYLYTLGVSEGISTSYGVLVNSVTDSSTKAILEEKIKTLYVKDVKVAEITGQIDQFYKDTANLRLPASEAYQYAIKRINGEDPQQLERWLAATRQLYSR